MIQNNNDDRYEQTNDLTLAAAKTKIIIIDDESSTRQGVARLIERHLPDFEVIGDADNGYEGMMLIKNLEPDIVIADIRMPRIDGLEMIENVKCCCPNTQFLILSGYSEFDMAKKALQLQVSDYLLKPVTSFQLKEALSSLRQRILDQNYTPFSERSNDRPSQSKQNASKELMSDSASKQVAGQAIDKKGEEGGEDTRQGYYSEIVLYIINEIESRYSEKLYLESMADKLRITPEYAGNLFSKETGKSFSSYLRDVRLDHAKKLLLEKNIKIYEIAVRCGYSDEKYFCRVFKNILGVSPKNYARMYSRRK